MLVKRSQKHSRLETFETVSRCENRLVAGGLKVEPRFTVGRQSQLSVSKT